MANRARQSVSTMDEHIRAINGLLRNLDSRRSQQLRLDVDSLSRSADYGGEHYLSGTAEGYSSALKSRDHSTTPPGR
ncbi:hypothetical protein V5735_24320 (plasmid) [Haladaptatus sp. SPP-AMP-3]|uniref:hypothetical protein n=1 Tax=Haladaptatus sp. SPP-AMP-3 TaxID=3121295 RepID=UPI003C2E4803